MQKKRLNCQIILIQGRKRDNLERKLRTDEKGLRNLNFTLKNKRFGAC